MRFHYHAFALGWVIVCGACASSPPTTPAKSDVQAVAPTPVAKAPVAPVPLEEYFKILRIGTRGAGASFSFDEKLVAFSSDQGGRIDLWVAPVEGGSPRQITKIDGFLHSYAFSPASDVLVYEADQGGNELPHLFLTDSRGAAPKDLCAADPQTARTGFVEWAQDGRSFLYLSSRRDEKLLDLYEYGLKTGKSELVWQASGQMEFGLASRDHRRFVLLETLSDVNSNMYLVERGKKGAPMLLTPHTGDVLYVPTDSSRDAKTLYYTSDEGGEFSALYALDLSSRKAKVVLSDKWDVVRGEFSRGWRYFWTETNIDGTPSVAVTDTATGKPVALPSVGEHVTLVPIVTSKSDTYLAVSAASDAAPASLAIIDMKKGTITRPVEPLPESLRGRAMVAAKSVRIPSFDGREVPAFLYAPQGTGKLPAVIDVHGGPTAQSKREFSAMRQYLVSKGYVVLVPNVRGSTGYGKSYTKLDNLDLGGGPLKDVVACKSWLVSNADVGSERVAILGASYGGYMSLAAATFAPTEFAAHVDYYGVSDLKTLIESFPAYWAAQATYLYQKFGNPNDPKDAQYQHDRSPINSVDKIVRPLLVVQGENDARVKKDQSDRIVAKLKERGIPVHYLILHGEGHGFSQTENRLAAYEATDRFLDRYLFGDSSIEVIP